MELFLTRGQAKQLKPYKELFIKLVELGEIKVHQTKTALAFNFSSNGMVLYTGFGGLINYLEMLSSPEFMENLIEEVCSEPLDFNHSINDVFKNLK